MSSAPPRTRKRTSTNVATRPVSRARTTYQTKPRRLFLPRSISAPFPQKMTTTVKYAEFITVTNTAGFGRHLFSVNSLFDPNHTGVGTQPLYFDQIMAIYNHYNVSASRCKISVMDAAAFNMVYAMYIDDDITIVSDAASAAMRPGAVSTVQKSTSTTPNTLYLKWSRASAFPNAAGESALSGNAAASPTEQAYYTWVATDPSFTRNASSTLFVEMEFDVEFFELKTIPVS